MQDESGWVPRPDTADRGTANRDCVIVLGNHVSHAGIGEHVYTLHAYFSRFFRVSVSEAVVPGRLNIFIDEFANPDFVRYLAAVKRQHPGTQYVVVATEFYVPLPFRAVGIVGTFNFFGTRSDWCSLGSIFLHKMRLKRGPLNYMYRRYLGFAAALDIVDAVLAVHPAIASNLALLARRSGRRLPPAATIYPTIDLANEDRIRNLNTLPFGFTLTGSLTPYRSQIVKKLVRVYRRAGYNAPIYMHVPFGTVGKFCVESYPVEKPGYVLNLNPPQARKWAFSSPMRILRAALLGQIPVISKKFGDHEIEAIALLWDDSIESVQRLWSEGTLGRETLVAKFIANVATYNVVAEAKNKLVTEACVQGGLV